MASSDGGSFALTVIDALDHPHGNRILRTRVSNGAPTLKRLKGITLRTRGPNGQEGRARVLGFPVFGGAPSDERIRDTGRVDLVVEDDSEISRLWKLEPA